MLLGQKAYLTVVTAYADPEFSQALYCTFQFERPQRLKAVVLSSEGGDDQKLGTF